MVYGNNYSILIIVGIYHLISFQVSLGYFANKTTKEEAT
jgi:hypothetical protein